MSADAFKRAAAEAAVAMIKPRLRNDSIVGVGTGSTANAFIDALAPLRGHFDATVSSSEPRPRACAGMVSPCSI